MAGFKIMDQGLIYRNPSPHVYSKHAYFPSAVQLPGGEMVAAFCIGQAFESEDLHTWLARSTDGGAHWELEGRLLQDNGKPVTDCCRLSYIDGELIAYLMRHNRSRTGQGLANPENIGFVETEMLLRRSRDGGRTWGSEEPIQPPLVGPSFEMNAAVFALEDGRWLLPTSTWRGWEGYAPNGMGRMVAFVSHDRGRTWPEYLDMMANPEETLIYWESKVVELEDHRLIAAAWTYNEGGQADLPIQYTVTNQRKDGFTPPQSTGLKGQTIAMAGLAKGRILTVYRRTDIKGLWANISSLDGETWVNEAEFQLWGHRSGALTADGQNMVDNFHELKFGAPALAFLDDGVIFITFWAVEEGISNIRCMKFTVDLG